MNIQFKTGRFITTTQIYTPLYLGDLSVYIYFNRKQTNKKNLKMNRIVFMRKNKKSRAAPYFFLSSKPSFHTYKVCMSNAH